MKKGRFNVNVLSLVLGALILIAVPSAVLAATLAGEDVYNEVSVSYFVNSVAQTAVTNSTTFLVDRKVDVTVADQLPYVEVAPGATGVLEFTVTNNSNDTLDFNLSIFNGTDPHGGLDKFDPTFVGVFVENGASSGYQAGEDTATFIDNLSPGIANTVYIVATIPLINSTGDIAAAGLLATAALSNGTALTDHDGDADDPDAVQNVFADAAGDASGDDQYDAEHSDTCAYKVKAARLSISKSSTVISDPFNNTDNPKAIPGAVVEYTITIQNNDSGDATDIEVSDDLSTEISNGTIIYNASGYSSGKGIKVQAPNLYSGSETELTDGGGDDEGDYDVTDTETVTVTDIDLNSGQSATVKFRVVVQ